MENNGKVMVVLTSWVPKACKVKVNLRGVLAGYSGLKTSDPETGKAYLSENGQVEVMLDKWGVRLLTFEK